jgi:hypothetical protein
MSFKRSSLATNPDSRRYAVIRIASLAIIVIAVFFWFFPWHGHVSLRGKVVNRVGEPIAGARIIATLRRNGFPYDVYSAIATTADDSGQFSLDLAAPRRFHDIIVEVSTPTSEYGRASVVNGTVAIVTSPLPPSLQDNWAYHYGTFRGGFIFGRDPVVIFVGKPWTMGPPGRP